VPLWLFSKFSPSGKEWVLTRPNAAKWLQVFAIWAVADKLFRFLGKGVMNNWTNDTYDWRKEIVIITGGSDGIGACVVKLLGERKIKVVILDIQDPKFSRTSPRARPSLTGQCRRMCTTSSATSHRQPRSAVSPQRSCSRSARPRL
jgi:hypothetical protein